MTQYPPHARAIPVPIQRRSRWAADAVLVRPGGQQYTQGALALTYPLADGLAEPRSNALSIVSGPGHRPPAADPRAWASRFLQAVVEVVANERPLTQLARWTDKDVFAEIAERRQRVATHAAREAAPGRWWRPFTSRYPIKGWQRSPPG